jgi:hypothetical protein
LTANRRAFSSLSAFHITTALVVSFVVVFRLLALKNGFPNDHFLHLAGAQQIFFGEWPTRDFQDPGMPLMYLFSAGAQMLLGQTLFAEAVLVAVAFAAAALLTIAAIYQLTGSKTLALLAGVLEVAMFPRTYGYPKVLLYAAAFLMMQRYVSRPGGGRLFGLAVVAALAFLFRHDHGLYLAVGGALSALLAPTIDGWRQRVRTSLTFVLLTAGLVAPYLLYVQLNGGLLLYLRTAVEFSAREAGRQWHVWPSLWGEQSAEAVLVYAFHALPAAAILALLVDRRQPFGETAARVIPVAVVGVLVNVSFIRDPLNTRLADAIVPAVMLGAWLMHRAWTAGRWRPIAVPVGVAIAAIVGSSILSVGKTAEELNRSGLLVSWLRIPEFLREVGGTLRSPLTPAQIPSTAATELLPFMTYAERCTDADQRLLVMGFLPEVPVLTRRAFAGGQSTFIPGYYGSDENQRLVLKRLRDEVVPFVLVPGDYARELDQGFPAIMDYVHVRYMPFATLGEDPETGVQILLDRTLRALSQDAETGWPCF